MSARAEAGGAGGPILQVVDLQVRYGGIHALRGVSLAVGEGQVVALIGANGAGKTTTLRAISKMLRPAAGAVRFRGEDVTRLPSHALVARGMAHAPEGRGIFLNLTVRENLELAERNGSARYELVHDLFPELRDRAGQRAGTLSGGQQQMVAIARALLNRNALLLIDEPTKGLAPALVADVAAALERVAEHDTVLLVEQNLGVVRRLASAIVVLDQGRVVHTGTAAELEDAALVNRLLGAGHAGAAA